MAASSGMAVAMYLEDFLIFYEGFQLRGIWNPIYSIREWELCPLNLSIGGFALAAAAYKMAGVFVLTALVMLASSLARSSLVAGLISVLMVMGAAVVNNLKWDCDILGLLTSAIDLKKMEVCRWLDMPVLKIDFQAATGLLLMVAALATAYFLETRWKCVRRRERI